MSSSESLGAVKLEQDIQNTSISGSPRPLAPAPQPLHGQKRGPPTGGASVHDPPAKKQSKWSAQENTLIIELRGAGMKWEDISKRLPGRSAISCRLHYQNFLERRAEWDEEKKNKLARLYERFKKEMWDSVAKELQMPWRAVEAMHWQLGSEGIAQRAGVPVFQTAQIPPTMPLTMTPSLAPAGEPSPYDSPYSYSPRIGHPHMQQPVPPHPGLMHSHSQPPPTSTYPTSSPYAALPLPPVPTANGPPPPFSHLDHSRPGSPRLRRSYSNHAHSNQTSPPHQRSGSLPHNDLPGGEGLGPYQSPTRAGVSNLALHSVPPTSHPTHPGMIHERDKLPPMRYLTEPRLGKDD